MATVVSSERFVDSLIDVGISISFFSDNFVDIVTRVFQTMSWVSVCVVCARIGREVKRIVESVSFRGI